ncbi:MAG: hypothetical protein EP338_06095 [Bacteroidetes bacterium]|nr:MAG: hypothetical protein EP338_06095 [Bacteroidota bacterium]
MKTPLSPTDLVLLTQCFISKAFKIRSSSETILFNGLEDIPSSTSSTRQVFVFDSEKNPLINMDRADLIIDFGNHLSKTGSVHRDFFYQLNEDGSLKNLSPTCPENGDWKHFALYSTTVLFLEKEIKSIIHNSYLVDFGRSARNRHIEVKLLYNNSTLAQMTIAHDQLTLEHISHEKYLLTKLQFYRYHSFLTSNEYFTKNALSFIRSTPPFRVFDEHGTQSLQKAYFDEIYARKEIHTNKNHLVFWHQMKRMIQKLEDSERKVTLGSLFDKLHQLPMDFHFFSGLQPLHNVSCDQKLVFPCLNHAELLAPAHLDFIHSIITEELALGNKSHEVCHRKFFKLLGPSYVDYLYCYLIYLAVNNMHCNIVDLFLPTIDETSFLPSRS